MGKSELKKILAELDLTIKELSASSGVNYKTLSGIVNGRKTKIDNAYAISEALNMHIDHVFPDLYLYAKKKK